MKITYLGTTVLLFDDGKDQLLFDCHISRPSIFKCLFGKLDTDTLTAERVIKDFEIDRLRGIFVSHSHHDHVMDAPFFANKLDADFYGSASALNVARGGAVPGERFHCFENEKEYTVGDFTVSVIPSVHSKAHWYNNDLGKTIDKPVKLPASKKFFKEGGSYDFLITHDDKTFLIRPSYNFLKGQLDEVKADVVFLGIGGLSKDSEENVTDFFAETVGKVKPQIVVPVHWDNFFSPLYGKEKSLPILFDDTDKAMKILNEYCGKYGVDCIIQKPLTSKDY